ncbi:methylated-DNA--[protein]-cysteine S-methyltransferase [Pullulanibacillus sp. KACC 23026]|uniref:methylated-DNA--[protein]-cysteine S-methyltransferase n=1 Tax=Pullulanibacillus sp. KACC 23026 TaxID=3028315 RepID=UPI0023B1A246|nr:methylated-DNA--[protein]-cysteine S-methyltransferase [Pullulanibacillus sp. KACC 23026]WEG12159.1 methylated-DNA--[protein]-cysteine S-methyltransferase [Pullulanibacillus sp. KACC 23026]
MEKKPLIYVNEMESPIGPLTLGSVEAGLCYVSFGHLVDEEGLIKAWAKKHMLHNELVFDEDHTSEIRRQLEAYFQGQLTAFDLPIVLKGSPFQIKVWKALQMIPYGETRTYKDIAAIIGNPKSVRAVGGANNKNPIPIIIPCHRVIGSNGALVGYGGGLDKKEYLLAIENNQSS